MDCFADETRIIIENFNKKFFTPDELIDADFDEIKNIPKEYVNTISRWYKQPEYGSKRKQ